MTDTTPVGSSSPAHDSSQSQVVCCCSDRGSSGSSSCRIGAGGFLSISLSLSSVGISGLRLYCLSFCCICSSSRAVSVAVGIVSPM